MIHYEKNISVVTKTLVQYQYDKRSLHLTQRCYDELRHYMENEGRATFSLEPALEWCKSNVSKKYQDQFVIAIHRLADVYAHGHVLKEHLMHRSFIRWVTAKKSI